MVVTTHSKVPDNTPIIVGASQWVQRLTNNDRPPFTSPVQLAAKASQLALQDAGIAAGSLDTIAVTRTFADAAPAWASPFGGSNNPPESVARLLGAKPSHRIYSNAGGTEPLQIMMEMALAIARGEKQSVLLTGAEAIANERYAQRHGFEDNWIEEFDEPLDNREYRQRFVSPEEIHSGLGMPTHYYSLIENAQAASLGHNGTQHRQYMARMLASFSSVAADNVFAQSPKAYTAEQLATVDDTNYALTQPYSKWLVAQDAVNQSAALVLTSAGHARQAGIDPQRWVFLHAYAQGIDHCMSERADVGRSEVMTGVLSRTMELAQLRAADIDLIDIYSCFPCAVHAASEALNLPTDGSKNLTVTGGLPFFGGPGNNYTMHPVVEMVMRLRGVNSSALVTANGGILSKHAAVVLSSDERHSTDFDWQRKELETITLAPDSALRYCPAPTTGKVLTYTVIHRRGKEDIGVVLANTDAGERFLASTSEIDVTAAMLQQNPIGAAIEATKLGDGYSFNFARKA